MSRRVSGAGARTQFNKYTKTVGIDVDSRYLVTAFYDHDKGLATTTEFEQSETGIRLLVSECKSHGAEIIVLESTANYHVPAYDALILNNLNAIIINPLRVKALLRVEGKSDKADAITLARLAASFRMKGSNMPDSIQREARTYWRIIDLEKKKIRSTKQRITAMLLAHGCTVTRVVSPSSRIYKKIMLGIGKGESKETIASYHPMEYKKAELLDSMTNVPNYVGKAILSYIKEISSAESEIIAYEIKLSDLMSEFKLETNLMCTVPAINDKLSWRFISEMGLNFHERYPTQKHFCKALGIVPANIVSGGKLLKREASHGNNRAKQHLLNNVKAWSIRPHQGPLYEWYKGYKNTNGWLKAISALSHKVAEGAYIVMKYKVPFDEDYYFGKSSYARDKLTGEIITEDYEPKEYEETIK